MSPARLRRAGGAAAVVSLLAAALVLALLAADVRRWERALDRTAVALAAGPAQPSAHEPDTRLPASVSRALLGVSDDVAFRRAVERFWLSEPRAPIREFADVTRRTGAERELARLLEREDEPRRRAVLATLRGALLLEEARNSPAQRQVFVRRAIEQFRRAATLDPSNLDAVFDLELALKLLRRAGSGDGDGGDARSPLPSPGAGSASSGSGF